ncbi:monovalent cation/H(+) antiporter subunit G [Rhodoferax sp.]|uniref:monovalent cation/H(+) antiporter subunit G n=1 Tax=Rhodoferax sp. TaxID=50421 RepID=UPI00275DA7EC|nr:monovalent cation/H(+) antiporter subunit G [Rhodoferax sp.]
MLDLLSVVLLSAGAFFFLAGTVGLLRFPDVYTRLHALTKVDNLGLGFVVLALMLQAGSLAEVLKLALIWGLALAASAAIGYLVAHNALESGVRPWQREPGGPP